jgi:hypothetical protein
MQYNVSRGLREIVAPKQTMPKAQWKRVLDEFGGLCVFCDSPGTAKNRGIVPDHLIPVTRFGELVLGNTVPACQTCNDSRGEKDWRPFMRTMFPGDAESQITAIEAHVAHHSYQPVTLEFALAPGEQEAYAELLQNWEELFKKARMLHESAQHRRKRAT